MKLRHKDKVKLARKMQSKVEATTKGSRLFDSKAWTRRREMIQVRVMKHDRISHERAIKRHNKTTV